MGKVNETVRTVNSAVRTLLLAVLLVVAGVAGWKGYSLYNEPQKKLADKQHELDAVSAKLAGAGGISLFVIGHTPDPHQGQRPLLPPTPPLCSTPDHSAVAVPSLPDE